MAAPVYDFDEDEKNEPVGFQQDPDSDDFGDGYFTYADGTRKYASDPDSAGKLSAAGKTTPAQPGQGTAAPVDAAQPEAAPADAPDNPAAQDAQEPPAEPGTRLSYAGDTDSPYANAVAANEGATGSAATGQVSPEEKAKLTASPEELKKLGAKADASNKLAVAAPLPAPGPVTAPAPMGPPAAPTPPAASSALPEFENKRAQTTSDSSNQTEGHSKSVTGSVSRSGQALSPEEFAATQGATAGAYDRAQGSSASAYDQQAHQMQVHALALQQDAKAREAAAAAAIAQRDQRAAVATQKIKEVSSRKTDVNQIWKDKGALGTLLGGIGVAMGSLYATRRGGPNTALESIETQKQQAIKKQLDDRDSELRGLERELGSLDAAVPVYEARMNDAIKLRIEGMMGDEKSQAVRTNGTDLINKLDLEKTQKLSDALKAYHGTIATQQAGTVTSQGSLATERRNGTEASDVRQNPKATGVDADKRDTDQGKAAAVIAAGDRLGKAFGGQRDKDGNWVPGGPEAKQGTDAEKKAAHDAYVAALTESGYKPDAAEQAAQMPGDSGSFWKPNWLASVRSPEDAMSALNAHEGPIRERMTHADRQKSRAIPLPRVSP